MFHTILWIIDEGILVSRWTYKPFGLNISELSDCTESEDDDPDARKKRIEK